MFFLNSLAQPIRLSSFFPLFSILFLRLSPPPSLSTFFILAYTSLYLSAPLTVLANRRPSVPKKRGIALNSNNRTRGYHASNLTFHRGIMREKFILYIFELSEKHKFFLFLKFSTFL